MKIAFFIDNCSIADVDVRFLEKGNPGIGGTEYLILLVASMLSSRSNGLEVKLLMTREQKVPQQIQSEVVGSLIDGIKKADADGCSLFILKHHVDNITEDCLHSSMGMQFLVWCHIFPCYWELDYYASNNEVRNLVFVGREMMDLYRDHPVFAKATYIYNCVSLAGCRVETERNPFESRGHVVTYMGSLVPFKGFHLLAKAWPYILERVPDAQLYVIGSGQLYDTNQKMGPCGIAQQDYEELIMGYLAFNGKLHDSVHFMGRMGNEKKDILLRTKVGVPNPSGITETFCLTAVEMQMLGARIATVVAPGYLDTVKNGVLFKHPSELADAVVKMLEDNHTNYSDAVTYFEQEFSVEHVLKRWEHLLWEGFISDNGRLSNVCYRFKWLKETIRQLSRLAPLNRHIPLVERVLIFAERRILRRATYMDSNLRVCK